MACACRSLPATWLNLLLLGPANSSRSAARRNRCVAMQRTLHPALLSAALRAQPQLGRRDVPHLRRPRTPSRGSDGRRVVEVLAVQAPEVDVRPDFRFARTEQSSDLDEVV